MPNFICTVIFVSSATIPLKGVPVRRSSSPTLLVSCSQVSDTRAQSGKISRATWWNYQSCYKDSMRLWEGPVAARRAVPASRSGPPPALGGPWGPVAGLGGLGPALQALSQRMPCHPCLPCGYSFHLFSLNHHIVKYHRDLLLDCNFCHEYFPCTFVLAVHIEIYHWDISIAL